MVIQYLFMIKILSLMEDMDFGNSMIISLVIVGKIMNGFLSETQIKICQLEDQDHIFKLTVINYF